MSDPVRVFFNPSCSKCRGACELLESRGVDATYYRYLEERPARAELEAIVRMLGLASARGMMRTSEPLYEELGLESADDDRLFDAMLEHPILIERPIVIRGDRAVIARPPEKLLALFDEPATIRHLTPNDVGLFRQLQRVFAKAFDDRESYESRPPSEAYMQRWLSNGIAVVALVDEAVVGGLAAYVLEKFEQERSEIYIYDLAVDERVRRRGIASALIRELQKIAKARGAWVIYVQADHGDDPAIRLYESLGTREEVLHFDIPV